MDTLLSGQQGLQWTQALENEWDRLATGKLDKVKGSNTISFIPPSQIPSGHKVTYGNFVCDHRPLKAEPLRVRLTVGGDRLDYPYDTASPASNLVDAKLLINSVILDANIGAQFMAADLKDFFLNTPMERAEYMKIKYKYFPSSIRTAYDLQHVVTNDGWVYIKIIKGMYSLKQAAKIAYDLLKKRLALHGYYPSPDNINIWRHATRPTKFCLCVDDFGIKYFNLEDVTYLLTALKQYYKITEDWKGNNYLGLNLDWNYQQGYVDISMPGYIAKVLHKFRHMKPSKDQYAPHKWTEPVYGKQHQTAIKDDKNPILPPS